MQIIITQHAIDQYRNKTFGNNELSDEDIRSIIIQIAKKGTKAGRRAGDRTYKICHQGLAIVAQVLPDKIIVITYLGNPQYQNWYVRQDAKMRKRVACR